MASSVPLANSNEILYAADLTIRSKMSFLTLIKNKLQGSNTESMFRETCFGHWLDVQYTDNEPALVNLILQTQIPVDPDSHEEHLPLVYNVSGFNLEFGREQFCLVTGLLFGPIDWSPYSHGDILFRDRVFRHVETRSVTLCEFTRLFHSDQFDRLGDEDAIRVCLVICLELIFNGREHTSVIRNNILRIVEDIGAWNAFPWGSYVWSTTYASIRNGIFNRRANKVLKAGHATIPKYTFGGFIWAFKIWILETFAPHNRCWAHDFAIIPRALGWKKLSTFHVNEDASPFLRSIHNLNPPIHPLRAKDRELAQEWYISSTRYFNSRHPPLAANVKHDVGDNGNDNVHLPLAMSEKVIPGTNFKHEVGDNGNDRIHATASEPTVEERLLALESIGKEMYSDLQSLKNRVLVIEQKVQDYIFQEDEDWHKLEELLEEHENHMEKKDKEVEYSNNLNELHNQEVSHLSIDELARKVDRVESIVDRVGTRARSVFSYKSLLCDDVLADNLVVEDTANTGYCPLSSEDVQVPKTQADNEKEETMYVLNKECLGEILTQFATGVNKEKQPFIGMQEFKKSDHYKRFQAQIEAKKRKNSFPWSSDNVSKPSTDEVVNLSKRRLSLAGLRDSKKEGIHLKSVPVKACGTLKLVVS